MDGARTPLASWFAAAWYVVNQKQGVSALGLQRVIGLGSYETARAWLHKLRRAMVRLDRGLLTGPVEVDETIIGGTRPGKRDRGSAHKALVAIAVEARAGGPGRVRMQRIPNASKNVLTDFVLDHVTGQSEVRTDAWGGYNGVGEHRFAHIITNVSASGDPAHVSMPEVHRAASLLKRWPLGTHQGAVSHDQLDYLPGRVHIPLQPPRMTPPRTAVLPAARTGRRDRTTPAQRSVRTETRKLNDHPALGEPSR